MKYGHLRDYFLGVGVKQLTAVDAEPKSSNQHEIGTTMEMRSQFLGERQCDAFSVVYVWLGEDQDILSVNGNATYYDSRRNQAHRSPEWRLYYPSNVVTEIMKEGDTLFLAMAHSKDLYFIVTPRGTTSEQQLAWLFGLNPQGNFFVSREIEGAGPELDFAGRFVLDDLGIMYDQPNAENLDSIIDKFGTSFPSTRDFSHLARSTLADVNASDDPDTALVEWLNHEEALFRRLERRIVTERLEKGFTKDNRTDVDAFIGFSLSVQNRRKARMGFALENHLEAVFQTHNIAYTRGAITENNNRPDFLFPSSEAYHAATTTSCTRLVMLGAKSTCKDRWRQVLVEASKIPRKHLLTLEPGISENQTDQMESSNLQLIVPRPIHGSYGDYQQNWLWNLNDFMQHLVTTSVS